MKLLSPEQQLKEKRPGMPENLKRIREQQIRDIPQIPFEPELKPLNYPRDSVISELFEAWSEYDWLGEAWVLPEWMKSILSYRSWYYTIAEDLKTPIAFAVGTTPQKKRVFHAAMFI
ncbi:hypothetical protein U1Q18_043946 [Sarracenia purpurea var. burkii]